MTTKHNSQNGRPSNTNPTKHSGAPEGYAVSALHVATVKCIREGSFLFINLNDIPPCLW
jgi:hypothetical protein